MKINSICAAFRGPLLNFYNNSFSARVLFITGFLLMPALFFNPSTENRVVLFLFFMFLVLLSGKKINFIFTIFVTLFIIAFNLIIPYGKVLFSVGIFKITSGALEAGIHRAVTLQALVMLSKVTIRQDLLLPGAFGELLSNSLRMFSFLMNRKFLLTGKNPVAEIDNLMLELNNEAVQPVFTELRTKPAGFICLVLIVLITWIILFAGLN